MSEPRREPDDDELYDDELYEDEDIPDNDEHVEDRLPPEERRGVAIKIDVPDYHE